MQVAEEHTVASQCRLASMKRWIMQKNIIWVAGRIGGGVFYRASRHTLTIIMMHKKYKKTTICVLYVLDKCFNWQIPLAPWTIVGGHNEKEVWTKGSHLFLYMRAFIQHIRCIKILDYISTSDECGTYINIETKTHSLNFAIYIRTTLATHSSLEWILRFRHHSLMQPISNWFANHQLHNIFQSMHSFFTYTNL